MNDDAFQMCKIFIYVYINETSRAPLQLQINDWFNTTLGSHHKLSMKICDPSLDNWCLFPTR